MDLIKDPLPRLASLEPRSPDAPPKDRALARLLLGRVEDAELPSATDLAAAATTLALGARRRVLLPLAGAPGEVALERRGDEVLVSLYTTTAQPDVLVLERRIPLRALLDEAAGAALRSAKEQPGAPRDLAALISERARASVIAPLPADETLVVRGGAQEAPRKQVPIAFGYELTLRGATRGHGRGVRADVHALLFDGLLTAYVHGRRVVLARGPIMAQVIRMLTAARSVQEARNARQTPHVRSRLGSFAIAMRTDASGKIALTLDGERDASVTAAGLDPRDALLPIARLAAEIARDVIAFDRTQAKNLRLRAIREDVRTIRRLDRPRDDKGGFTNDDADRLRAHGPRLEAPAAPSPARPSTQGLRFGERWRVALDGLDASGTFLCGDRLVVSSSRHTVALARDDGSVLWAREANGAIGSMVGDVLVRSMPDGLIELCSLRDGEPFAETRLPTRSARPGSAIAVGDATTPPVAVLREAPSRLAAIDLRTGELVWRFGGRHVRPYELARVGRMLIVASEDAIHGLDAITGEELFRHVEEGRSPIALATTRDRVICVFDRPTPTMVVLDAFRGEALLRVPLAGTPRGAIVGHEGGALVALAHGDSTSLVRVDGQGSVVFAEPDPGLATGAIPMIVDRRLVLSSADGRVSALDLDDGSLRWSARLARPNDDVPRVREPLLRAGVLFVPGAEVHVLRPHDGSPATSAFPCDLIPDRLLVDERSWVYVAEESGHLAAYAPVTHLTLIRGGR